VYGDVSRHPEVRRLACAELRAHPERYASFPELDGEGEPMWVFEAARPRDFRSFLSFVERMGRRGEYGCHATLHALVQVFRRRALVHVAERDNTLVVPAPEGAADTEPFRFVLELDRHYYAALPQDAAEPQLGAGPSWAGVAAAPTALPCASSVAVDPRRRQSSRRATLRPQGGYSRAAMPRPRTARSFTRRRPLGTAPQLRMASPVARPPPLFFWSHRRERAGRAAALSNWYGCSFDYDGRTFHSSEQAIMYEKAALFGDDAKAAEISAVGPAASFAADDGHGKRVQRLGREVAGFDEAEWAAASPDIASSSSTRRSATTCSPRSSGTSSRPRRGTPCGASASTRPRRRRCRRTSWRDDVPKATGSATRSWRCGAASGSVARPRRPLRPRSRCR